MDAAITTGIFTLGGTALGGIIVNVNQRAADQRAVRSQAGELLATVTTAAIAVQTELAMYRERRVSVRANGHAAGQVCR